MPNIKTRIVNKHDISDNWANSTGFVPMNGEIIIYSADSNTPYPRFKVGNGEDTPNELPFSSVEYMTDNEVDALFGSASTLISFTFEGTTYNAMSGWTWQQFIGSEYNPNGNYFSAAGEYVSTSIHGGSNVQLNGISVLLTDIIQANASYTASSAGGID